MIRSTRRRRNHRQTARHPSPRVVFALQAQQGLQRGIRILTSAVRPTLGPRPRLVAADPGLSGLRPELLDEGSVVARRIVALADRDADPGAMLLRSMLWRLHEEVGDGTATAAVLFEAIYTGGLRWVRAGGDPQGLRHYLEAGLQHILTELHRLTVRIEGQDQLTHLAESLYPDPVVAGLLGEIFHAVGEYGQVDVRSGYRRTPSCEFVEGSYWPGGVFTRQMLTDTGHQGVNLENAAIVISDAELVDPWTLAPVLDLVARSGAKSLLIVAALVSEKVLAPLLAAQHGGRMRVVAVKTPGSTPDDQFAALEDLAVLTGGRPIMRAAGESLSRVRPEDLGHARRVWADALQFGVIAGLGDAQQIRTHINHLCAAHASAKDTSLKQALQKRIGKLQGGSATLWLGGTTEVEIKTQETAVKRAVRAMRHAVRDGVVPGGGVALLACQSALLAARQGASDSVEIAAYNILAAALEAPFRTIVCNAGFDSSIALSEVLSGGSGFGLDVRSGRVVRMGESGIWDVAAVVKAAVRSAVQTAALALTIDVVVHRRRPKKSLIP